MREEREKQVAERRKEKNKTNRNKYAPKIVVILILIITIITLSFTVFFKVGKITVEGDSKYSADEIIKASGLKKGDSILLLNTESVEERIEDTYDDIGKITVDKKLITGKIIITDEGFNSLFAIQNDDGYYILDSSNKVRRVVEKKPKGMLKVVGLDLKSAVLHKKAIYASENTYGVFVDLLEALKSNEFDNITRIDVSEIDNIVVSYDGRIKMKIGTMSNLDEKLKKARYIVMEKESKKAKGTLDLTVDNTAYFKEKK